MMTPLARTDTSVLARWWWTVDRWTLVALCALIAIGVLLTATASPPVAERIGLAPWHFVFRQGVYAPLALAIMLSVSMLNPRQVRRTAVIVFAATIGLLLLTLATGTEIKGAKRWINLGGLSLQASEFIKPAFAVCAAWMFSAQRLGERVPGNLIAAILFVIVLTLLLAQPDVGQAGVVTIIWMSQWFLAGLPMPWLACFVVLALVGLGVAYFAFDHVASRIDRFIYPDSGDNYQIERALDAITNGGLFGTGPGAGTVKANLPDAHSDFIFAVAGEEFGLIASLLLIAVFAFVVVRGFIRVFQSNDLFTVLAVNGLLVQFALQALINMASTVQLMPPKGMTLPFISYGGSSIIGIAFGMGMVLALTRRGSGGTR
jgi:cell division protein FtsW